MRSKSKSLLTKVISGSLLASLVAVAASTAVSAAEEGPTASDVQAVLDNVWILIAAVLVIFMQAGFALVEAGLTRGKNVANIFMKNLMDFSVGAILFFAVGYAIAFGGDFTGIGGFFGGDGWFLAGDGVFTYGNLDKFTFFTFQVAFAATAATIVSGAMAERTKFKSYVLFSAVISAVIYPIVVRWQWGGGWLFQLDTPFHDFAGSALVHMTGGVAAAVGAKILGPRIGKYDSNGKPRAIPGHSIPFAIFGCFILLVGWYGFNPGSWLGADPVIGKIAVNTTLAAAAGALVAMFVTWKRSGKPDVAMTGNGLLAGLVGVTAGCWAVNGLGAIVIGALAGVIVVFSVIFFDRIRIDDPVGAVSVHGVCGAFGTLAVGLFSATEVDGVVKKGLFYGGGADQLVSQLIGVVSIAAFVLIATTILFSVLKATVGLRVSEQEEREGLDTHEHGVPGYTHD
ncbi:MAG: ammonium transporter [Ilumatobacteraceae bacterium]|jgi:ammonium transporter, Amt family|nr:ammonium transporter [Ilumatobacteraceae bacterium]